MSERTAAIIGSTGMIGTALLELLLRDDYFSTVRTLVRRPTEKQGPKHIVKLVDFDDTESVKLALEETDTIFCCIGTTQRNVRGDRKLYRKIDYEIPVNAARLGLETGVLNFVIITAVGADSRSSQFYVRLKGELEDTLAAMQIPGLHILQPSMLLGERQESRPVEGLMQGLFKFISKALVGSWRKYRAVRAETLAAAMLGAARTQKRGVFKYTYDQIQELAAG